MYSDDIYNSISYFICKICDIHQQLYCVGDSHSEVDSLFSPPSSSQLFSSFTHPSIIDVSEIIQKSKSISRHVPFPTLLVKAQLPLLDPLITNIIHYFLSIGIVPLSLKKRFGFLIL